MIDDLKNIKLNKTFWNGLFITLMVFLVWWGYNFIRGPKIEEGYSFQVKFDDILSLTKGNDVIYSGLTIGEVKEVGKIGGASSSEITPIVTLSIKKEYEDILYKDAVFTIKSPLFVGDYWVEVSRGIPRSQDKIVKGEVLEGVAELNPSKLPAEIQKGLKPILINFESFSTGLVSLFNPTTIDDLKQSIANIKESTLKAKTLTDKFDIEGDGIKLDMQVFNETMANLSKVSSELKISLDNIEDASRNFKKASEDIKDISGKLNNGEGSLGKLINDSDLYDSIGSVVNNIGVLIKKLSDDPTLIRPSIWK
tara:strand:+ start:4952 stop:5878 length:927 start_codon:yes stop_codon:yes gene_type:complete